MMLKHVRLLKHRRTISQLIKDALWKLIWPFLSGYLNGVCRSRKQFLLSLSRYDDDANDDPDYQQPASMSQKDEDMDDEDDKVTLIFCSLNDGTFHDEMQRKHGKLFQIHVVYCMAVTFVVRSHKLVNPIGSQPRSLLKSSSNSLQGGKKSVNGSSKLQG